MRTSFLLICAILLVAGSVDARTVLQSRRRQADTSSKTPPGQAGKENFIPGSYIVSLKDDCQPGTKEAARGLADKTKKDHKVDVDHVYEHAMRGFAFKANPNSQNEKNAIAALQADPCVRSVEQNRVVKTAQAETVPTGVRRLGVTNPRASSVAVAIIDTGILSTHPDLAGLVKGGVNCVGGTSYEDDHGHGTHVAGTVAALANNGVGVVGVAAGTELYAVKVLNSQGSGSDASIICGLNWVAQQNALLTKKIRVVNLSIGGGAEGNARVPLNEQCRSRITYSAQHEAICKLARNLGNNGAVVVVAAGNEASDLDTSTPAAYPEALTVTAVSDSDGAAGGDAFASFSNYVSPYKKDAVMHTVAGPGVNILSTTKDGAYGSMSGTSMASPHITGVVALCFGTGSTAGPCTTAWNKDNYNYGINVIKLFVRGDAIYKQTGTSGFTGDRDRCNTNGCTKHYGYLVNAASF